MNKILKRSLSLALVLALVLALFAGCGVGTPAEKMKKDYGITFEDKTEIYTGDQVSHKISVDKAVLGSKSYSVEYVYLTGGAAINETQVLKAGTYEVEAHITADGLKEPQILKSKLTIAKATLDVKVPDQFIRKGSNLSTINTVFADLDLLGTDKVSSLGLAWSITNASSLGAMTKLSEGKKLEVTTTSENYTLNVTSGKLYVLDSTLYADATTIKQDIENIPDSQATLNTYDRNKMQAFQNAINRVQTKYPKFNDVQKAYAGQVNLTTAAELVKVAESRVNDQYDLSWDSNEDYVEAATSTTWESIMGLTQENLANILDDEGKVISNRNFPRYSFVDGFVIDNSGRATEEIYDDLEDEVVNGTTFYFALKVNNPNYDIKSVKFRDKEYDITFATDSTQTGWKVYQITTNNTILGPLTGSRSIEVAVTVVPKYKFSYVVKQQGTGNMNIDSFRLYDKLPSAESMFEIKSTNTGANTSTVQFLQGKELTLIVTPEDGHRVTGVNIGDQTFTSDQFKDGKLTFILDDNISDTPTSTGIPITFETERAIDFKVLDGVRTLRPDGKIYSSTNGEITIDGLETIANAQYAIGDTNITITIAPNKDYAISSISLKGTGISLTAGDVVSLKEEISANGEIILDFSVGNGVFNLPDLLETISLVVEYVPIYDITMEIDGKSVLPNASGVFVTDKGEISILNQDGDVITEISEGQKYYISVNAKDGYIVRTGKVGSKALLTGVNKAKTTTAGERLLSPYYASAVLNPEVFLLDYTNGAEHFSSFPLNPNEAKGFFTAPKQTAGSDFEFEFDFDSYYAVSVYAEVDGMNADLTGKYYYLPTSSESTLTTFQGGRDIYIFESDDSSSYTLSYSGTKSNWSWNNVSELSRVYYTVTIGSHFDDESYITASTTAPKFSAKIYFEDFTEGAKPGGYISVDVDSDPEYK